MALLAGDWLPYLAQIAGSHPGLKLAVDHMGALRGAKGDAAFPNMKELTALAKYPNVSVKLTGGPFYADCDAYPFRSLHKHYRALYDAFGPRRLFWGTDITKMPCSWRQCVTRFQEIVWIPEADKQLIMGRLTLPDAHATHAATAGGGRAISLASRRRFWAMAASVNSNWAPRGPRSRRRPSRRMRFR